MDDRTIVAAAGVTDGAMVALVPTAEHAARLAIEGGEPVEQLHATVAYLGDASQLSEKEIQALHDWADRMGNDGGGWRSVGGRAFAPSIFNPDGPEPCVVLVLSGDDLAEFRETAVDELGDIVAMPLDAHRPYIPHVTLSYVDPTVMNGAFGDAMERVGDVVFDRLRIAIAGSVYDVPLAAEPMAVESDEEVAPDLPAETPPDVEAVDVAGTQAVTAAASTSPTREAFDGCIHCWAPRGEQHRSTCPGMASSRV